MKVDLRPVAPPSADSLPAVERVAPAQPRQGTRFEALLDQRERKVRRSLRGELEQTGQASGVNAQLFGTARSLQVLRYVLDEVLPVLDAEPEIRELAEDVIREEIDMRLLLEQQRAEVQS
ncbi:MULTISPECIES: hypothetical protein [Pseudomonas]|uniref:Uncharacterized protein n=11 Tax=Pseudomonas syringae group TaxID=136849 RepID=A0A2K4WVR1_PSESX|nr:MULTISPECIES: hypothetical protein [Pseudomonas]KPX08102.1 Uncharacterized protein ALO74_04185 [Pseudomonas syringae pv. cunninghamiae]ARD12619.1 hypothetical protein PSA3335_17130 [Pseudomonas savastanoi pv. savastanoi NCPPB 3335]AVB14714.1 hypothetical protein BKM19_014805 [Pseudomonas amygdali pv. morsprunorum]EGH03335.1 hypothetical protein PSYAE_15511 [Pseudomonas amygdali pv. aesculi str. 0893_23]KAA3544344.1 hypothetical protein DXU85_13755 [Pseudomonas savastanoi]